MLVLLDGTQKSIQIFSCAVPSTIRMQNRHATAHVYIANNPQSLDLNQTAGVPLDGFDIAPAGAPFQFDRFIGTMFALSTVNGAYIAFEINPSDPSWDSEGTGQAKTPDGKTTTMKHSASLTPTAPPQSES